MAEGETSNKDERLDLMRKFGLVGPPERQPAAQPTVVILIGDLTINVVAPDPAPRRRGRPVRPE